MKTYEAASHLATFGFFSTLLVNSFLIFLTLYHIKHIYGTYKWMIVIFASIGIGFSLLEVIVKPCIHNYNKGYIYFSRNMFLNTGLLGILTACYSGVFCSLLAFVTIQFVYRCWVLIGSKSLESFSGIRVVFWVGQGAQGLYKQVFVFQVIFVITPNALFASVIILLLPNETYSDSYMQDEMLRVYGLNTTDVARFIIVVYDDNENIRWRNVSCVITLSSILTVNLAIIGYSAFRMRREMAVSLKQMSERSRNMETQFFKALLAQSTFPTLLLVLPIGPVLLLPFFNLKISLQTGLLFSLISLYPPMDSIAMMMIITEYRACIHGVLDQFTRSCRRVPIAPQEVTMSIS